MTSGGLDKGCSSGRFIADSIYWFTRRRDPPRSNEQQWLCRGEEDCEATRTRETYVTPSAGGGAVRLRESTGCSGVCDDRNREAIPPTQDGC